ncbi:MAG: DUF4097 domain-containing protein [Lachnospiraceae bacterium]|nr:DUF4097 domain-containing protein [Lachnospiraceae bacterium]
MRSNGGFKIFTCLLGLITIVAIIWGACRHFSLGGIIVDPGPIVSDTKTLDAFHSIDAKVAAGGVVIQEGSTFSVEYTYPEKYIPQFEVKNDTLIITQKTKKNTFNLDLNSLNSDNWKLTLTIPEGTKMDDVTFILSMGSIEGSGLTFGDVKIVADMGSIEFTDTTFRSGVMDADMGAIDLATCNFDKLSLDADMGAIDVKDCTFDSLSADADMGGITVSGTFDSLKADCDMGSIEVTTDSDPSYELVCDMGGITINGEDMGRKYKK